MHFKRAESTIKLITYNWEQNSETYDVKHGPPVTPVDWRTFYSSNESAVRNEWRPTYSRF
jgi:hypothetical protein